MTHVVAQRHATALVQAGSQIPAAGMFGHLVQTATLPEPCLRSRLPENASACGGALAAGRGRRWWAHSISGRRAALVMAIAPGISACVTYRKIEPAVTAGLNASKAAKTSSFSPVRTLK